MTRTTISTYGGNIELRQFDSAQQQDLMEVILPHYCDPEVARKTVDLLEYMWLVQNKADWPTIAMAFNEAGFAPSETDKMESIVRDEWTFELDGARSAEKFPSRDAASKACDSACMESPKGSLKCRLVRA